MLAKTSHADAATYLSPIFDRNLREKTPRRGRSKKQKDDSEFADVCPKCQRENKKSGFFTRSPGCACGHFDDL